MVTERVSPLFAPTWKVTAAPSKTCCPENSVRVPIAVELREELGDLACCAVPSVVAVLFRVHSQLTHPLQDRVHLVERTLGGLHEADAVLGVADRLVGAADLGAQALGLGRGRRRRRRRG
jgi:hypothetical protein